MTKRLFWERFHCEIQAGMDDDDEESGGGRMQHAVLGPHGLIPVKNKMLYTKHLDLWNIHSNFDLTVDLVRKIERVPGVEVLLPVTRYCLRVGLKTKARLFAESDIKDDIEYVCQTKIDALAEYPVDQRAQIRQIKNEISAFPYWAMCVLPDGKVQEIHTEEPIKEFFELSKVYQEAAGRTGGIFFQSDPSKARLYSGPKRDISVG
jgi:hypothetical protein